MSVHLLLVLTFVACHPTPDTGKVIDTGETWKPDTSDTDTSADTSSPDTRDSSGKDTGDPETGPVETGDTRDTSETGDTGDTGEVDVPLDGFGEITGECGVLDQDVWDSSLPALFRNTIDFGTLKFDLKALSPGGQEIWADGNLGGSSIYSEMFSYEVLYRCEGAALIKTEGEIIYQDPDGIKTDILVDIDSRRIGTSVARAFHYPPEEAYTLEEGVELLDRKLSDILVSAANADPKDAWERSMLHIIAWDGPSADIIEDAWEEIDDPTRSDTILYVTVTDGTDDFIY